VLAYFVSTVGRGNLLRVCLWTGVLSLAWAIPYAGLRIARGVVPYRAKLVRYTENIESLRGALNLVEVTYMFDTLVFVLMFLVLYALWRNAATPDPFLARNLLTVAAVFATTMTFARLVEIRVLYPVLPVIVPLALRPILGEPSPARPTSA
jgi:hypothetical protein